MNRVIFVATEFDPLTPGGAGTLIAGLAARLVRAGRDVTVMLVGAGDVPSATAGHVSLVGVEAGPSFLERSAAAAEALGFLGPDAARIEFQDFEGLAFETLARRDRLGLSSVPITVRFHGPTHLLLEGADLEPTPELRRAGVMEQESLSMADAVLVPSPAIVDLVAERYGVERHRIVEAPPIVPDVTAASSPRAPVPEIVSYGRLAEAKGSGDLLAAAVPLLVDRPELRLRFVGHDGWSFAEDRPMREVLAERVPAAVGDRVSFEPSPGLDRLGETLAGAWVAVVPSRFESFCLAAHELRRLGLPLVVPDLAAFRPFFDERSGAVRYDGTVADLQRILADLLDDPDRLDRLAAAPAPVLGDPLAPYDEPVAVRPLQARSALATAALDRVGRLEANEPVDRGAVGLRRVAAAVLRHLPEPVAAAAVRLVPQGVKDRFRSVADWRVEAERRRREERRQAVWSQIDAGGFPDLADPRTTIVIPCFDQGRYLDDAILSVFEQTDRSFEIVVVDDGSSDPETVAVIDGLRWPRTRVIRQANRGLPAARNVGIASARGRFVVPLDADDMLEPGYLAALGDVLDADPSAAYVHCDGRYFGDLDAYWITRPFNPYTVLLSNSVLGCVVLRREAWEAVDGYDETMRHGNEDWDLWLRLLEAGWGQLKVHEPLFRYRRSGTSMSIGTLAKIEEARVDLARRHRTLYGSARDLKRAWYPWVSIVVTDAGRGVDALGRQTVADAEVVAVGPASAGLAALCRNKGWELRSGAADVADAVGSTRGKFVLVWDDVEEADASALERLAEALEDEPDAATAGPGAGALLWRRWVLVDPDAPPAGHVGVEGSVTRPSSLRRAMAPDPAWMIPSDLPEKGLDVIRQPPEEEGRFPAWIDEALDG